MHYSLSVVVATDKLKLAPCLAVVDPVIGGVLIEGPCGMVKSTLARGVAEPLSAGGFVALLLGASEEHIVGSLDLDATLGEGRARFSPGALAETDDGVLYVDEANLLLNHLVDLSLDVAASGINLVERDGISHWYSVRLVLIDTMNPEEGELCPQLPDRFGLDVRPDTQPPPAERAEVIRRRLTFDADPQASVERQEGQQDTLRRRYAEVRRRLAWIPLDDAALDSIARHRFETVVDGLRANPVWLRATHVHATWHGGERIEAEDIDAVEYFALLYRRHRSNLPLSTANPPSPPAVPAVLPERAGDGEGQWGELPARPVAMGTVRKLPCWSKKPWASARARSWMRMLGVDPESCAAVLTAP